MVGITNKTLTAEIRRQQQLSQSIIAGQAAISSGVTLTKPSDNALAWVQVSDIGRAQAQQAAWQANVGYGTTRASNAESNLEEINNLLVRAQDLVTSARNGSLNDTSRDDRRFSRMPASAISFSAKSKPSSDLTAAPSATCAESSSAKKRTCSASKKNSREIPSGINSSTMSFQWSDKCRSGLPLQ